MADPTLCPPLTRASVLAAHGLIQPYIHTTPVLTNATLSTLASTPQTAEALKGTPWEGREAARPRMRLWFKCENFQKVGAFKTRGAFSALLRLVSEEGEEKVKRMGVVTHSSGNHAQALSLAARTLGIPATIVMPHISTPSKIAATQGYGSKVLFSGSTSEEREAVVQQVIDATGARLVPPYDHPDIILGQGTLGIEMQEQVRAMMVVGDDEFGGGQVKCSFAMSVGGVGSETKDNEEKKQTHSGLDAIIAPCGGGGMLSGVALACEDTGIYLFAAEPSLSAADDLRRGLLTGERITSNAPTATIADGLRTPVGVFPWGIIHDRGLVRGAYGVSETHIGAALRLVLERMKMVVEPSAVVGLAVCLFDEDFRALVEREGGVRGWDVGVVVSGGNLDLERLGSFF